MLNPYQLSRLPLQVLLLCAAVGLGGGAFADTGQRVEITVQRIQSDIPQISNFREALNDGPQTFLSPGIRSRDREPVSSDGGGGGGGNGGAGDNENAKADAKDNSGDPNCTTNPVVIASGEKYKREIDFESVGLYGLSLERVYRSRNTTGQLFGPNWTASVDAPLLTPSAQTVSTEVGSFPARATIAFPGGTQYVYNIDLSDYPYAYRVRGNAKLGDLYYERATGVWTLWASQKRYNFLAGGGMATSIDRFTGERLLTINWVFTGTYRITRVTNLVGQQVNFTWTGDRVTQVTSPGGNVWTYAYNSIGMLTSVTSPGPSADVRTYHYDDSLDPKLLTGISINGVRYSTYAYYADKRVRESALAGGEERDQFTYGTNTTSILDAKGQTTTYTLATSIQDSSTRKITGSSRAATSSCVAAAASTGYDLNGYIDHEFDWNGNRTEYTYNA